MSDTLFTTTTTTTKTTTVTTETSYVEPGQAPQRAAQALLPSGVYTTNPIKAALAGVPAKNYFLHTDDVITIQSRAHVPEAIKTLVEYNISCAPVLDDTSRCIGLFGIFNNSNVLDFVLKVFNETAPLGDNYMAQLEQATRMCIEPCSTIAGGSKRDKYCPVSLETPLFDAITLLDTHNLHRVPVVDSTGQITSLITQTGVLQWFGYNMEKIGPIVKQKVQDIQLGFKPVVMINGNEPAIEAFRLMEKRGISSVAVVDNDRKLVAVVSTADLKGVTSDPVLINRLHLPVISYLALLYPQGTHSPVVCSVKDSVEHVINTMISRKIHRVYLVDSNSIFYHHQNAPAQAQQPVGVVSVRDLIHTLIQEDSQNMIF